MSARVKEWEARTGRKWTDDYEPYYQRSSFPWERRAMFEHLLLAQALEDEALLNSSPVELHGRRLQGESHELNVAILLIM